MEIGLIVFLISGLLMVAHIIVGIIEYDTIVEKTLFWSWGIGLIVSGII